MLIVVVAMVAGTLLRAAEDTGYKAETRSVTEIFTSKVLKVYSFQEADVDYAAYAVTWKDHEVIAVCYSSVGADKRYKVGDTIRCQMQQMPFRVGESAKARAVFMVMPAFGSSGVADELRRLDSIRADVEARRMKREADAAAVHKEP